MEKASKSKKTILKYLPRAASAVSFQNPPFSPSRLTHAGKGFSGTLVPDEARRKSRAGLETQEPTSPKVSCMGQIKIRRAKRQGSNSNPPAADQPRAAAVRRFFGGPKKSVAAGDGYDDKARRQAVRAGLMVKPPKEKILGPQKVVDRAPTLGQLRRFASGRDVLGSFDWTAQITPVELRRHPSYCSDEEWGGSEDNGEEVMIPFSAPMVVGGGGGMRVKARKEVNLWKRRTMAPPRHLQL